MCLPAPALCCPHKKRVRDIQDNGSSIAPSYAMPIQKRWPLACFKGSAPSLSHSVSLHPSVSLCPVSLRSMGNPGKDSFVPVSVIRREGGKGGGKGRFLSLVFVFRLPTVFLLLPSFIPPFSSFLYPKGDSLIRSYGSAVPSSLLVAL